MKTFLKDSILAVMAISLFFLSYGKQVTTMGTNTQDGMGAADNLLDNRCWQSADAWSGGTNYVGKGSDAMYTQYYSNNCVALYAGETVYAGTAHFSRVSEGKVIVTIALTDGWQLAPGNESVKIQGYTKAPKSIPAPGQFTYKGKELTVEVEASGYYGIHLDVRKEVACK